MTRPLSDAVIQHLRRVTEQPDLSGTRYELVRRLAQGGMGTLWVVRDRELDREVALKVVTLPDAPPALAERLRREARVLARLEHPNIVPVHDLGVLPDGRVYAVMKLVRGRRLDEWAREGPRLPAILTIFQRICEAVAFANAHGVVHRDLKPDNVMVGAFGEALVMDWGVAKVLASASEAGEAAAPLPADGGTAQGTIVGTPAYMAPEQARGETDAIDARTDVHALGAILYFLLAGRPPFDGAGPLDVIQAVTDEPPVPLRRRAPRVAPALESICARALAKAKADRYASAEELAADVGRFLEAEPVHAHPENVLERAARWTGKNRVLVLLLATYLAVRLVLLLFVGR